MFSRLGLQPIKSARREMPFQICPKPSSRMRHDRGGIGLEVLSTIAGRFLRASHPWRNPTDGGYH